MALQVFPNPMDLLGHVRRRDADDIGDLRRLQAFQMEEENVSIERLQSFDEFLDLSEHDRVISRALHIGIIGQVVVEIFQTRERYSSASSLLAHIGRCGVVCHTVDPGFQRALIPESRDAAPQRKMQILQEILLSRWVCLYAAAKRARGDPNSAAALAYMASWPSVSRMADDASVPPGPGARTSSMSR